VPSRERAQSDIEAGRVLVSGTIADKAARLVSASDPIELVGPAPRFVSRGGEKLDAALEHFAISVSGRRCLDAGASTGGFTDCLLQRGASQVVAVDVGYGQLHERLRHDDRVDLRERTNVRELDAGAIGGPVDVVVGDLSFISLRTVAPALLACAARGADLVVLVKPQFEAGRAEASKARGVIRDPAVHERVLGEVATALSGLGAAIMGTMRSPITGADGNVEFLLHARAER
jgi:23S rRNA (cytidine1920-2'-O)/16S rRNA (cytidine1409-2'-O)-methyltransferase